MVMRRYLLFRNLDAYGTRSCPCGCGSHAIKASSFRCSAGVLKLNSMQYAYEKNKKLLANACKMRNPDV